MNFLTKILEALVGNKIYRPEIEQLYKRDHPDTPPSDKKSERD